MSPRRSHSPGSMNPGQAREHRAWMVAALERALGPGIAFESCLCPSCASRQRVSCLRRSRTFRARCPSLRRAGRLWLGFFWLPHHPLRLPAPPRGWSCRVGPLNPGRTGVVFQAQWGEPTRGAFAPGAPRASKRRGRRAPRGWSGVGAPNSCTKATLCPCAPWSLTLRFTRATPSPAQSNPTPHQEFQEHERAAQKGYRLLVCLKSVCGKDLFTSGLPLLRPTRQGFECTLHS